MVMIEQEPEDVPDKRPAPSPAVRAGDDGDSDGFETASEADPDADAARDGCVADREVQGVNESVVAEQSSSLQGDPANDAVDEEADQKALERADEEKLEGNQLFRGGLYEEALLKYEFALQTAPDAPAAEELRSACHSNHAVCFLKMGKYEETIRVCLFGAKCVQVEASGGKQGLKECSKALELNPSYLKALVRRAEAHEKLDHLEDAMADCKKILELDPANIQARKSIIRLEPLAEEKREKMKEEMIGKPKDMGNSLLGQFGMSVDNFKAVKDPNTGSYSISFQQ